MELSELQKKIITTNENKVVACSCPGSGKTTCLTRRLKFLLEQGCNPQSIAVITFTNAAAEEILDRINRPKGLYVGTIHGLANLMLLRHKIDTKNYLESENFDKLFDLITKNPDAVIHYDQLLVDEAQDCSTQQFDFIFKSINPPHWMIFADYRQSIYRWNGAYPDYIIELMHTAGVKVFQLNENFRCGGKIMDFSKRIIQTAGYEYSDFSKQMRNIDGTVTIVDYDRLVIAKTIAKNGNFKDWFILTRTNAQAEEIIFALQNEHVPFATFKRSELTNDELKQKMNEDSVKVLTIHSAKGLEAKNVVVIGAKYYNLEEKCISYVAATRAKDNLIWTTTPQRKTKYNKTANWEK